MKQLLVICSTQRSGSTMVCDDIKHTNMLGCPNEYFLPFIEGQINCWEDFEKTIKKSSTSNGCRAIKVMASQLEKIVYKYSLFTNKQYKFNEIINKIGNPTYIRVIRKNKIRQAISRLIARHTGIYHHVAFTKKGYGLTVSRRTLSDTYNYELNIRNEDIGNEIKKIIIEENLWNKFFENNNIIPISVYYEEAVSNLNYLNKILQLHKIENTCSFKTIIALRNVKRLSNKHNQKIYTNYINENSS